MCTDCVLCTKRVHSVNCRHSVHGVSAFCAQRTELRAHSMNCAHSVYSMRAFHGLSAICEQARVKIEQEQEQQALLPPM
eukprot:1801061-Rhodomonas_salina.3